MNLTGARITSLEAPQATAGVGASSEDPAPAFAEDDFTRHIFSCLLQIALSDASVKGGTIEDAVGLGADDLEALAITFKPDILPLLNSRRRQPEVAFDEEEEQLLDLFMRFRSDTSRQSNWLAAILTRRCMSPNHLWQDLGLNSRVELGRLMREFFPTLAARNVLNMKWKKFFYRCLCEMEGFSLCASPTCQQCNDYNDCFGEETGLSRLPQKNN
ncbi:nitrogen fixation protein NifQ [Methylocystis heyeri]|uniref:Nitrogen fixation protein NifQ n=1 Tax=Methylocystis heyeri TaxID=391905 RepID=A0A6B8KJP1_9HYPH|nr:nitrogen fixation protein NifQ [Methylocystis heyeri]QGM47749.1 nitrogen fixation protein NifQ [Methylocystis heyeri]